MGILQKIRWSISAEARLLNALAELAGKNQGLVERLQRHAQRCKYEQMSPVLTDLAAKERTHVKALGAILSEHRMWAKLPETPTHEGLNDWERLSGDLEVLAEIGLSIGKLAVWWEGSNAAITERLREISAEDSENTRALRKLALKADPHALD
jgi:hypothetical protein